MGRLKIVAAGGSAKERSNARGRLFEKLMTDVLRNYGYTIDRIASVNYAGMEIDIEASAIVTGIPLYAECKCYESDVDSPRLQEFFGKFIARWSKDKRCQGLFIAIPGVNSHAKGFYKENMEHSTDFTIRLHEEDTVLKSILDSGCVANPDVPAKKVSNRIGRPGDWVLLYTDKGFFWVQYIISQGSGIADMMMLFDDQGEIITNQETINYVMESFPEIAGFKIHVPDHEEHPQRKRDEGLDEIVEVKGSSSCFEYQFPAAPEFFVGRADALAEFDSCIDKVVRKITTSRGVLFQANSGWGKSSIVLSCAHRLGQLGYYAIAIDSRTAGSPQFVLKAIEYTFNRFRFPEKGVGIPETISGFEGAADALLKVDGYLRKEGKILVIFFDQFENIFALPDVLVHIANLLMKIEDGESNIVFGFSWKTDLVGLTEEFPYQQRDIIVNGSQIIHLGTFSDTETNIMLDRLGVEIESKLRKDLRFFLSEFSQGYPWLLKRLCAHVKSQVELGLLQSDLAQGLLNVETLFREDLAGLTALEEETLRQLARRAPVNVFKLSEELEPEIVQQLVFRRLVVRVGSKFDIYWDIFRDYLNTGKIPIQENYILRVSVQSILRAVKILKESGGSLNVVMFQERAGLSGKSYYNIIRDMRVLGIGKIENELITLTIGKQDRDEDVEALVHSHIRERLPRNRLVRVLAEKLNQEESLTFNRLAEELAKMCPYVSATQRTWVTYSRLLADWMDMADLAVTDPKAGVITSVGPSPQVRDRRLIAPRRKSRFMVPSIRYGPLEDAAIRIVTAYKERKKIDWSPHSQRYIGRVLSSLEDLGFIERRKNLITLGRRIVEFVEVPDKRKAIFAERALQMVAFSSFLDVLQANRQKRLSNVSLGKLLRNRLNVNWKDATAELVVKVMLDWARNLNMAPVPYNVKYGRGKNFPVIQSQTYQSRLPSC